MLGIYIIWTIGLIALAITNFFLAKQARENREEADMLIDRVKRILDHVDCHHADIT